MLLLLAVDPRLHLYDLEIARLFLFLEALNVLQLVFDVSLQPLHLRFTLVV
jgi:hypothetical protein